MLKKQDAPRMKKFIATLMRGVPTVKDMVEITRDLEWLSKIALDLEKPDIVTKEIKSLDEPQLPKRKKRK